MTFLAFFRFGLYHPFVLFLILKIKRYKLSYLGIKALIDLYNSVSFLESESIPGILIEAGCALGGSALVIVAAKKKERPFYIYDTFELIPPPSQSDDAYAHERFHKIISRNSEGISGSIYYGYRSKLFEKVGETFREFGFPLKENNVNLIKGLFKDTLIISDPVALAHLDCDWYNSVKVCLQRITPNLAVKGELVIDDYFDWIGCKKAVDEYFILNENYTYIFKTRLHILRLK